MTIAYIWINGVIRADDERVIFMPDTRYDGDDVPYDKYVCNIIEPIIDKISEDGYVDIDITYGHFERKYNARVHNIEFFVNDRNRGRITIYVYYN